jgi:hypothetical protein
MAEVIPWVSKHKIGKDFQYPLQYSDIASSLISLSNRNVYLSLSFGDFTARDMGHRAKAKKDGRYRLLNIGWNPDELKWSYMIGSHLPWAEIENPIVVTGHVDAVPKLLLVKYKVSRSQLKNILEEQLRKLIPDSLANRRWQIRIDLLTNIPAIESGGRVFTGLRIEPEIKMLYPLLADDLAMPEYERET